jgi:pimeloyl-ACP methyl ester carboxylesterase
MHPSTELLAHTDLGPRSGAPALVMLPGWCGGREVFTPLLARTSRTRRSISIDWRGHGGSAPSPADFGAGDLVDDTVALIDALGLETIVPVALAHAGWVAIELRRRLGAERVPAVVSLDWMPIGAPPGFLDALDGLQEPTAWRDVRAQLFAMWTTGVDDVGVQSYVESMGEYGFDMWSRAGREIARAFRAQPMPVAALAELGPCPTLHAYAQPRDDGYLAAQREVAAAQPWFRVRRLAGASHFPCLEVPTQVEAAVDEFLGAVP